MEYEQHSLFAGVVGEAGGRGTIRPNGHWSEKPYRNLTGMCYFKVLVGFNVSIWIRSHNIEASMSPFPCTFHYHFFLTSGQFSISVQAYIDESVLE